MVTIAPPAVVVGAPRIPLPFGLFSVLVPRVDAAARWENGVTWETLTCDPVGGRGAADCDPDAEVIGLPKDLDANAGEYGEASSFAVYGHYTCSPIGNTPEQAQAKADQHLIAREEARVEQALWTGDLGNTPNIVDAAADLGGFDSSWASVAALEQHLAETYGSQGVLHMSRSTALLLFKDGSLTSRNGRLQTPLETPVIAGTGYPDDAIAITPALFGYRSEIFASSGTPYDLLDRAKNNLYAIAERTYLLGFDPCGAAIATRTTP